MGGARWGSCRGEDFGQGWVRDLVVAETKFVSCKITAIPAQMARICS